jgi:hypothetical protein
VVDAEHENAMYMLLSLNGIAPRVFASLDPPSCSGRSAQVCTTLPSCCAISLTVTAIFQSASSGEALAPVHPWRIEHVRSRDGGGGGKEVVGAGRR